MNINLKHSCFICFIFLCCIIGWYKKTDIKEALKMRLAPFYTNMTSLGSHTLPTLSEKPMVIIVTSYNNADWYKQNLDSIFAQHYTNYRIIYIDDCSDDNTAQLAEQYVKEHNQEHRTTLIKNQQWQGLMANHYKAVHMCDDHEIVVHVDGDDWLAHGNVLAYINAIYTLEDAWLTYGRLEYWPNKQIEAFGALTLSKIRNNQLRSSGNIYTHLRTFYAWLFKQIKLEDLTYKGSFVTTICDAAFMFPMVEMAGTHVRYIPEVLYIYNIKPTPRPKTISLPERPPFESWEKYQPLKQTPSAQYALKTSIVAVFNSSTQAQQFITQTLPHIKQYEDVHLIYLVDNEDKCITKSTIHTYHIKDSSQLKPFMQSIIQNLHTHYIMMLFDIPHLANFIDLHEYTHYLERSNAYSLSLNINQSDFELWEDIAPYRHPKAEHVRYCNAYLGNNIYAFQHKYAVSTLNSSSYVRAGLYRKQDIIKQLASPWNTLPEMQHALLPHNENQFSLFVDNRYQQLL